MPAQQQGAGEHDVASDWTGACSASRGTTARLLTRAPGKVYVDVLQ